MRGIRIGMQGMGVGIWGMQIMWGIKVGMQGIGLGMRRIRVGMWGIGVGVSREIKIKGNERIYKNIVLTLWYEKQLKKLISILIFIL